jgi:hypothetical protein
MDEKDADMDHLRCVPGGEGLGHGGGEGGWGKWGAGVTWWPLSLAVAPGDSLHFPRTKPQTPNPKPSAKPPPPPRYLLGIKEADAEQFKIQMQFSKVVTMDGLRAGG